MLRIQWDSRQWSTNGYSRPLFHAIPKSKIATWAWIIWKKWCNERNMRAKLSIIRYFIMPWYAFYITHPVDIRGIWAFFDFSHPQTFFTDFSKKSGPCLLSRSVLQCLYFPQTNTVFGITLVSDMLRDSAKAFCAPPELMLRTMPAHAKYCIDTFFNYCMNMYSFVMFIQVCGYNRARQRDKLARLLDDFGNLQEEVVEKLDRKFRVTSLWSYVHF